MPPCQIAFVLLAGVHQGLDVVADDGRHPRGGVAVHFPGVGEFAQEGLIVWHGDGVGPGPADDDRLIGR
jgi:hypothetical protein